MKAINVSGVSRAVVVAMMAMFALTLRAAPTTDTYDETQQAALQVVKVFGNQQFIDRRVVNAFQKTKIYEALVARLGRERAQQVLVGAVASSMPKYLSEQEQLLAAGLARTLPIEKLRSLATAGRNSPYVGEFRSAAMQPDVRSQQNDLEKRITDDVARSLSASLRAEGNSSAPNKRMDGQSASLGAREVR
jgi:hypothetical protein